MERRILWSIPVFLLASASCGGRSSIGTSIPGRYDGAIHTYDGISPIGDALPWKKDKWPVTPDHAVVIKPDLYRPPDLGCLPIPAGQVNGKYSGAWKGTLSCPGLSQQTMSGTLSLTLAKVAGSASLFKATGSLEGKLDLGLPVAGSFSGTMSCTALKADVPQIVIGSGAMVYKLQGGLAGTFGKTGSGSTGWGFPGGSLDIKDPSLGCVASGGWYAYR